ncbi:hypothetical protein [Actinomadura sp. J1-007]|uniref:hypothetical protein n=1 Tax=Actinomadura sp. J1-007 TaxID=2661913 RepID=UPI001F5039B1|nr:hypothetical protein [Actinomadura sp. J1-007]
MEVGGAVRVDAVRGAVGVPALPVLAGDAPAAGEPGAQPEPGGRGGAGQRAEVDGASGGAEAAAGGDGQEAGAARRDLVPGPVEVEGHRLVAGRVGEQGGVERAVAEDGLRPGFEDGALRGEAERGEVVEDLPGERVADDLVQVEQGDGILDLLVGRARVPFDRVLEAGGPERVLVQDVRAGLDLAHVPDGVLAPGRAVLAQQPAVLLQGTFDLGRVVLAHAGASRCSWAPPAWHGTGAAGTAEAVRAAVRHRPGNDPHPGVHDPVLWRTRSVPRKPDRPTTVRTARGRGTRRS